MQYFVFVHFVFAYNHVIVGSSINTYTNSNIMQNNVVNFSNNSTTERYEES